jgi:hypothetical protein
MISIKHPVLDAKALNCIIQAYDAVWEALRGRIFASDRQTEETRTVLVQTPYRDAECGERDPNLLMESCAASLRHEMTRRLRLRRKRHRSVC